MKIEVKEVVNLDPQEKEAFEVVANCIDRIMEEVTDVDIYNAAKQTANGLEELSYVVNLELD